jgi:ppGpp synthetase/RelA/SpoT-type nucleotidyltranferase
VKSWTVIRERDYVDKPKGSGYRAVQIVRRSGYPIEVQLRTIGQDVWANTVEQTGRQLGIDLKSGVGDERLDAIFLTMAELIARFDQGELSPDDLREAVERLPSFTMPTPLEDIPK